MAAATLMSVYAAVWHAGGGPERVAGATWRVTGDLGSMSEAAGPPPTVTSAAAMAAEDGTGAIQDRFVVPLL